VVDNFFSLCPDAQTTLEVDVERIEQVISRLGLKTSRTRLIKRLSLSYVEDKWTHVTELPGVAK
jgi:methyl-CpG-binding domain protein 4